MAKYAARVYLRDAEDVLEYRLKNIADELLEECASPVLRALTRCLEDEIVDVVNHRPAPDRFAVFFGSKLTFGEEIEHGE